MLTLTIIVGLVAGILWYLRHKLSYWQRKGVPTPGLFYQWFYYTRELPPYDLELTRKLGPVYGVMDGVTPNLVVSDLDLIRDILVKDFASFPNHKPFRFGDPLIDLNMFSLDGDDDWKRIRSLLSPTFTSGKLRSMEGLVNSCVEALAQNLGAAAKSGQVIDAKKYFSSLAFDALTRCAYGIEIDSLKDPNSQIQKNFELVFSANKLETFITMCFPRFAGWTGIRERAMKPAQFFVSMMRSLIEERSKAYNESQNGNGAKFNDFLQTMIQANHEAMKESTGKKTITHDEMMAQALLFLLAGFETTATIMAAFVYHAVKNPKTQEKLIAEVSSLTEITHDSVSSLKYLEAFLKESFRLSPPAIRVERQCVQTTLLGSVKVEPGTIVSVPVYAVHRDPSQYMNPDEFDPERFLEGGESANHHPYAYLPFGGGQRICIAQRFALMGIKLAFARIMKEYRFEATAETKMGYIPASFDILAPKPIMVKVVKQQ